MTVKPSHSFLRFSFVPLTLAALAGVAPLGGCGAVDPAAAMVTAVDAAAPPLAPQGAALVQSRGCPQCHQSSDSRYGVLSGQTVPRPGTRAYGRNLTPDPETGIGAWTDQAILRAIRVGVDDRGAPLCTTMPVDLIVICPPATRSLMTLLTIPVDAPTRSAISR